VLRVTGAGVVAAILRPTPLSWIDTYFFKYLISAAIPSTSVIMTRIHTSPIPPIIQPVMSVIISVS
jgi:hypothetical protein